MTGAGELFLVPTPIGNLEDITARALRVLREVNVIAAEDTRVTKNLLRHFDIRTPLMRWDAHTERRAGTTHALLARLQAGESVALVSDAGTPCLSDPGADLVAAAIAYGVRVTPLPGASALLPALTASGLPTGRFVFEGFLPRSNDRRERLLAVSSETRTVVLYEAPHRVLETLQDLAKHCGETRRVALCRELTKRYEEFWRGTLAEAIAHFTTTEPRGEFVLVLEGGTPAEQVPVDIDALLQAALDSGLSAKDAARQVAQATGRSRKELYSRLLVL